MKQSAPAAKKSTLPFAPAGPVTDGSDRSTETDNQLVESVRQGDRLAYGELVRRYEKKVLRTVRRMVGNMETAEDLTQDAFLKAYDRLEGFDSSKRFGPWLFQIAVNGAIDWLRRHKRQYQLSLNDMTSREGSFDVEDPDPRPAVDTSQEVQFVLAQVPVDYRVVLMLRDLEGLSCSEVAAIINRREPTVRWRLLKAREMFRDAWQRREAVV